MTDKPTTTPEPVGCCAPAGGPPSVEDIRNLKLELNQLIWQYAPGETTLGNADELAGKILNSIMAGRYLN